MSKVNAMDFFDKLKKKKKKTTPETSTPIEKKKTFWDVVKHIASPGERWEWEKVRKIYDPFLANRVFCSDPRLLDDLIVDLNRYATYIPKEVHYKLMQKRIVKNRHFYGYLKIGKMDEKIKKMALFYQINEKHMENYIKFLSPEYIKEKIKNINAFELCQKQVKVKTKSKTKTK